MFWSRLSQLTARQTSMLPDAVATISIDRPSIPHRSWCPSFPRPLHPNDVLLLAKGLIPVALYSNVVDMSSDVDRRDSVGRRLISRDDDDDVLVKSLLLRSCSSADRRRKILLLTQQLFTCRPTRTERMPCSFAQRRTHNYYFRLSEHRTFILSATWFPSFIGVSTSSRLVWLMVKSVRTNECLAGRVVMNHCAAVCSRAKPTKRLERLHA